MNKPLPFLAFDIEIASDLPEDKPWQESAPLGITCAAIAEELISHTYCGEEMADGRFEPRMSKGACKKLLSHLYRAAESGVALVGWNSLGFDFQVLGYETGEWDTIKELALYHHVDPAFQMLCERGYMVGLNSAAEAMMVGSKLEGVEGKLAPSMWRDTRAYQDLVLKYVEQDARMTYDLYAAIVEYRLVNWRTRKGKFSTWKPQMEPGRLLFVDECLELALPDTSWMDSPRPRSQYAGWLEEST